jgi:hypothetical protein
MKAKAITIRVDPEAARAYEAATLEERRKVDLLLNIRLQEVLGPIAPLKQVMREMSEKAQARGLTEEKLDALLTEAYLEARARRGSRAKYEAALARVPDAEPEPFDRKPDDPAPEDGAV